MCGYCCKINFNAAKEIDIHEIKLMTDSLEHRGPDDEGFYIKKNIGFGFRRLSIIDLHTGHQPMCNEDGTIWIVLNGEIYNYKELRNELLDKGHVFKTYTDTEVVVHLYEDFGVDCLDSLRGMFSFAIWDEKHQQFFCARDRFGKKPLYFFLDSESFICASEIKAILKNKEINKKIDLIAFDQYFTFGYITENRSIFTAIHKLPAAHYLILKPYESNEITINKYWSIEFQPDHLRSEKDWLEEFYSVFSEAVRLRMISDVPLGAFLSGGIDSSSVVSIMSHLTNKVKTFSIGFNEEQFNELPYAREVAHKFNTDHHELIIKPDSISILPELVSSFDEPFADSSAIPSYYITKFAAEHVTVVLSGDGGDELFAGYNDYPRFLKLASNNVLPGFMKPMLRLLVSNLSDGIRGKKLLNYLAANRNLEYSYSSLWQNYERKRLYAENLSADLLYNSELYKENILINSQNKNSLLTSLQLCDMLTFLPDDILTKVDRTSMHHSLEVRCPFLDHKLAELSFTMPESMKLSNGIKKYIIKKSMQKHLPENVLSHRKQGFTVPLEKWFRNELYNEIQTRINDDKNTSTYFNINYLNKVIKYHKDGKRDYGSKLWSVLFFLMWLDGKSNV